MLVVLLLPPAANRAQSIDSSVTVTHDLSLGNYISERTVILRKGRIVEMGPTRAIFENPHHPYTQALLSAVPTLDPDVRRERITLDSARVDRDAPLRQVAAGHLAAVS